MRRSTLFVFFFFFNDTATTEIYTLSLHDALPICLDTTNAQHPADCSGAAFHATWGSETFRHAFIVAGWDCSPPFDDRRSEEHTSELQSRLHLVCRLLLEKKKKHRK